MLIQILIVVLIILWVEIKFWIFKIKIMEKLNEEEIIFIPPEDIKTKLSSKDDLYRILTVDYKFFLIKIMKFSALCSSPKS